MRDPGQYVDPDRFNIRRTDHPRRHWVFGLGVHRCLGEILARAELAKMTPEQRTRLEAAMKAHMAKGAKPTLYKECMTPEKIARGFEIDPHGEDASCKRNVVSSSTKELTLHDECNKPERKTVTDVHFEVKDGTQMSGKINIVMTSAGKTMTVNNTMQGKWLGASCGTVKDAEMEK